MSKTIKSYPSPSGPELETRRCFRVGNARTRLPMKIHPLSGAGVGITNFARVAYAVSLGESGLDTGSRSVGCANPGGRNHLLAGPKVPRDRRASQSIKRFCLSST